MAANILAIFAVLVVLGRLQCSAGSSFITDCLYSDDSSRLTLICSDDQTKDRTERIIQGSVMACPPDDTWVHYQLVYELIFQNCHYKTFPGDFFSHFLSLKTLKAERMGLTAIRPRELPATLRSLHLAHNEITDFHPNVLRYLFDIEDVDLAGNQVQQWTALSPGRYLRSLSLDGNANIHIDKDAFSAQHYLKSLRLNGTGLTQLDFSLPRRNVLRVLDLSANQLEVLRIGDLDFLKSLEELNLQSNVLKEIQFGAFSALLDLVSLDLSDNRLQQLDFGLFLPAMQALERLRLRENNLTELHENFDGLFPKLAQLEITQNDFNCTYLGEFLRTLRLRPQVLDWNDSFEATTNLHGISCKEQIAGPVTDQTDTGATEQAKVEQGFESGYNVSIFILLLWVGMLNLVICGTIFLAGGRLTNFLTK